MSRLTALRSRLLTASGEMFSSMANWRSVIPSTREA
jgi:hypothetical protein